MQAITIEAFNSRDTDAILRLWRRSQAHGIGIPDPNPSLDGIEGYFEQEILPNDRVMVAKDGDDIVGVLAANRESISALYVRVERIGQGIGTCLLEWAKSRSNGSLWLFTFARNAKARRFYRHHGFAEIEYGFEPVWKLDDVKLYWSR